ncbi:class I SAM-dependent methyltransferase, partial [bacterium]|nr:class I SAM-dependent methyltransferase [bacterium]
MVECNVCNWQGEKFSPMIAPTYRRENAACPQCGSLERHRSLLIFLQENRWLRKGIRCLDVAPMRHFKSLFERCGACYVSIDLTSPRALKKMDLTSLEFGDNEFDLIICYHVLEHIK